MDGDLNPRKCPRLFQRGYFSKEGVIEKQGLFDIEFNETKDIAEFFWRTKLGKDVEKLRAQYDETEFSWKCNESFQKFCMKYVRSRYRRLNECLKGGGWLIQWCGCCC